MKIKTSITRSDVLLAEIDRYAGKGANRSEFIETAVRGHIAALVHRQQNSRDLAIINRRASRLNREANVSPQKLAALHQALRLALDLPG